MKKKKAAKSVSDLPAKTISAKRGKGIKGGRAARGVKPVKYMEYKLKEVLISGVVGTDPK